MLLLQFILYAMLFMFCLPFLLLASVGITVLIMSPFHLVCGLLMYDGDWREMLDMEFGCSFRKFDNNCRRVK